MTLTTRYLDYLSQIAEQSQMALLLAGAALLIVANCYALRRERRWLWLAAGGFWVSWIALIIWKAGDAGAYWKPISLGFLMNQPLWYDEAFTWAVARLPIDRLLAATAGDVHPPTWYLITHWTMKIFGDAEWALRLPALLFGLASLALTYRLARALGYGHKLALGAVLLLAILPGQINYAQEARMYTLLQAAGLVAALGIYTDRLWMMAAGMIAALLTHNLAVVHVAVLAGLAIWRAWSGNLLSGEPDQWARIAKLALIGQLVLVAYLPWARVAIQQSRDVSDGFWIVDYGPGGYLFESARAALLINQPGSLKLHLYLLFIGLVALIGWHCWRDERWELLALLSVPALILIIISELWRPLFLGRALVPSLPFLALLAAAAIEQLPDRARSPVLWVLVPMLSLSLLWPAKRGYTDEYGLFEAIEEHHRAGDAIYHASLASYMTNLYYARGAEHAVWPDAGNLDQALTLPTQRAMNINRQPADELIRDHNRLLIVWIQNPMSTVAEVKALHAALELGQRQLLEEWECNELVDIKLWEVRNEKSNVRMR